MLEVLGHFIIFSIVGYIGEVIHCTLRKGKSKKGLYGPWCPIYGIGGILILRVSMNLPKNIFLIYISGLILASFTEYSISFILEIIFKKRWWDYSKRKFNINGRICLENSFWFGFLAILLVYVYTKIENYIVSNVKPIYYNIVIITLSLIILVDAIITLWSIITSMNKNKDEKNKINSIAY